MVYASSIRETKEEIMNRWQAKHETAERKLYTIDAFVQHLAVDTIAIEGIKVIELLSGGQKIIISSRYRDIYCKHAGDWKILRAYQLPHE
jgi:hypothetical protein